MFSTAPRWPEIISRILAAGIATITIRVKSCCCKNNEPGFTPDAKAYLLT